MRLKLGPSSQAERERESEGGHTGRERDSVCVYSCLCVPEFTYMVLSVFCVCVSVYSWICTLEAPPQNVTWSRLHPVPAALWLSGFRSQSYDMAHSPAAQHAPLFICVRCGAMLSALGLGFWPLLAISLWQSERVSHCQAKMGLLWQQDTGHQWMCGK